MVINLTDGESTDGDPAGPAADESTTDLDGNARCAMLDRMPRLRVTVGQLARSTS